MNQSPVIIYAPGVDVLWLFRSGLRECNLMEAEDFRIELDFARISAYLQPNQRQMLVVGMEPSILYAIGKMMGTWRQANPQLVAVNFAQDAKLEPFERVKVLFDRNLVDNPRVMRLVRFDELAKLLRAFLSEAA